MTDRPIPEPTRRDPAPTLRETAPAPTLREGAATPAPSLLRLPSPLAERYRIQRHLPTQGAEADLLLVESLDAGPPLVVKLYRPGLKPNTEVLARLSASHPEAVVRLLDHGQAEGIWYEVMEWAAEGSLRDWLATGPLTPPQARELLAQSHAALEALHAQRILHRDLKPENLLIRRRKPLRLALTDFGIASVAEATLHFTSAHRTLRYAAPEASAGAVSPASDYWSLGMILAEALSGRHPYAGLSERAIPYELATRPVPLDGLPAPWLGLCRGLLLRDPQRRWGGKEVGRWLAGDPSLAPPSEEPPPADERRATRPYRLGGRDCWTAAQLAARLAERWSDGVKDLQRGLLTPWLRDELRDQDAVRLMMDLLDDRALSPDARLFQLLLHLDPGRSPVWKGHRLDDLDFAALARRALENGADERSLIAELWAQRVFELAARAEHPAYAELHTAWAAAVADYEQGWTQATLQPELPEAIQAIGAKPGAPESVERLLSLKEAEDEIAALLAAYHGTQATLQPELPEALPGLLLAAVDPAFAAGLRKEWRDGQRSWKAAAACPWFKALSLLDEQSPAQALVALRLGPEADRLGRERWQRLSKEIQTLRSHALADSLAQPPLRELQVRFALPPRYDQASDIETALAKVRDWPPVEVLVLPEGHERTFSGHTNEVRSVAFSPDGRFVLSGSDDKTLKLWEVATGREIRTFSGHTERVNSVAFSPDGRYALSGSWDRSLKLWEVATGREVHTFSGHNGTVHSVAFSPDGRYALSGSYDHSLKLWEVATEREVRTFSGHIMADVNSVAFSPDGRYALSGSYDHSLKLWEVATGREVRTFSGHTKSVNSVAFSPDGSYALSGSWDRSLKLWEVATGREVRTFSGHTSLVNSVAFSPDGRYALSGSYDHSLKLWEVATGREVHTFSGHNGTVHSVAFSPDGRYALSGSEGKIIKLWALWRIEPSRQSLSLRDFIPWERENARALAPHRAPELLAALQRDLADLLATNSAFAQRVAALSQSLDTRDPEAALQCLTTIPALRTAGEAFRDFDRLRAELKPLLSRSEGLRRDAAAIESLLQGHENLPAAQKRITDMHEQAKVYAEAFSDYDLLRGELHAMLPRNKGLLREAAAIESLLQKHESLPAAQKRITVLREQAKVYAEAFSDYNWLQTKLRLLLPRSEELRRETAAIESLLQEHENLPAAQERIAVLLGQARAYAEAFHDFNRLRTKLKPLLPRSEELRRDLTEVETLLSVYERLPAALERVAALRERAKAYAEAFSDFDRLQAELNALSTRSQRLWQEFAAIETLLQEYETLPAARERLVGLREGTRRQAEASQALVDLKNKYVSFASPEGDFARDCAEVDAWFQADRPPEAILERIEQIRPRVAKLLVAQREYERLRTEFAALISHTTALESDLAEVERRLSTQRYDEGFAAYDLILGLRERAVALQESFREKHFAAAQAEEAQQDQRWRWRRNYQEAERRYRIAADLGHPQAAERLAGLRKKGIAVG